MRTRARWTSAVVAAAAVAWTGCYYGPPAVVAGPAVTVGPAGPVVGPPAPGAGVPHLGIGASVGLFTPVDPWVDIGFYWNLNGSLWLGDMLAIELDVGSSTMTDSGYGGELTVTPVTVSAVFSLPDPWTMNQAFRWRLGVGAGVAGVDHSLYVIDPSAIGVFTVQTGTEFLIPGMGRMLAVVDLMFGEEVSSGGYWWDLSGMTAVRVGLELTF